MEKETYRVANTTRGIISFNIYPVIDADKVAGAPGHKRRKVLRSSAINVVVPHGDSVDLVEKTGLSIAELGSCSELSSILATGKLMLLPDTEEEIAAKKKAAAVKAKAEAKAKARIEAKAKKEAEKDKVDKEAPAKDEVPKKDG